METAREVEQEYVADGRVTLVFVDFPLPNHGFPAFISHEAAHCAGEQDLYWEMHDKIFELQGDLSDLDPADEDASREALAGIADEVGLDGEAYGACMDSEKYRPIVAGLTQQSQQSGVNVTPSLLVQSELPDGQMHTEAVQGYVDFETFRPYVERAIARSLGTPVPDPTPAE